MDNNGTITVFCVFHSRHHFEPPHFCRHYQILQFHYERHCQPTKNEIFINKSIRLLHFLFYVQIYKLHIHVARMKEVHYLSMNGITLQRSSKDVKRNIIIKYITLVLFGQFSPSAVGPNFSPADIC